MKNGFRMIYIYQIARLKVCDATCKGTLFLLFRGEDMIHDWKASSSNIEKTQPWLLHFR